MALFKGSAADIRSMIGNMSAPWLLLAFWSTVLTARGRIFPGALLGLFFTELALVAFYLGESVVFHISIPYMLADGRYYYLFGSVSGPIFGALGAWQGRLRRGTLWVLMALLFVVEPLAWLSYFHFSGQGLGLDSTAVLGYGLEVIAGLCAVLFVGRHFGVWRRADRAP